MTKKQRGQGVVELALVLPLFLIILFGIIHFSLVFLDYMTLNNIAANVANQAIKVDSQYYDNIREGVFDDYPKLYSSAYKWDNIDIEDVEDSDARGNPAQYVKVTVHAEIDTLGFNLGSTVAKLMNSPNATLTGDGLLIEYTMFKGYE